MRIGVAGLLLVSLGAGASALGAGEDETRRLGALALDRLLDGQSRVQRIADPIRIAGASLCGDEVGPVLGVYTADERTFLEMFRGEPGHEKVLAEVARERFGLGTAPTVLGVAPGLPADLAGLAPGDIVTRIDGKKINRRDRLEALKARSGAETIRLTIERQGEVRTLDVAARSGCRFPSLFWFSTGINAFAVRFERLTGMYVLGGMLRFFESDEDLAIVLGHELAHLILTHLMTTQRTEAEADYLGIYLAARAGFDVSRADRVFEALGRENPYSGIDWGFYAHPTSPARSLALHAAIEEIAGKRARGEPLVPEGQGRLRRPQLEEESLAKREAALRLEAGALLRAQQARVLEVGHRLATSSAPLCGDDVGPVLGAAVGRRRDFLLGHQKEAEEAFGAVDEVKVFSVAEGSPAARAALQPGDLILSVDGASIRKTEQVFAALRASSDGAVALRVQRDGETRELALPRLEGCHHNFSVFVGPDADTRSHQNGEEVLVPTGLLRFVRNDHELAVALAHQIAHNVLGSSVPRRVEDEAPADRLGLRIAARAGFDVSVAPAFWDRLAAEEPSKLDSDVGSGRKGRRHHVGMPARARDPRRSGRDPERGRRAPRARLAVESRDAARRIPHGPAHALRNPNLSLRREGRASAAIQAPPVRGRGPEQADRSAHVEPADRQDAGARDRRGAGLRLDLHPAAHRGARPAPAAALGGPRRRRRAAAARGLV